MKVTRDKTENSQAYLTIEVDAAELEAGMQDAYHHLVERARIPGFRKGKAPRAVLERYVGKGAMMEEALDHLIPRVYENAIKEQKIEPVAQPQLEITQTEPVIFKAVVPLSPAVTVEDYTQIRVKPEPAEVKEEDVNAVLDSLRHQHATWEPVERPVEFDDLVTLDVESSVEDKPFLNEKGAQYQVLKDLVSPVPGFAEQLPGMKKGESKEFKLKFPADYPREGFAGKEASFKVTVNEIKQEKLPELDDDLAKKIGAEFETVAALRERVSGTLKTRAEEKARLDFEEKVVDALVGLSKVEFPPVLVDMEVDRLIDEQSRRLQLDARGLEEYLKGIKKTGEELRAELRPIAEKRVVRSLALGKVADAEKIEIPASSIDMEAETLLKAAQEKDRERLKAFLDTPRARDSIRQVLLTRKTLERLIEISKGPETAPPEATAKAEKTEDEGETGEEGSPQSAKIKRKKARNKEKEDKK